MRHQAFFKHFMLVGIFPTEDLFYSKNKDILKKKLL